MSRRLWVLAALLCTTACLAQQNRHDRVTVVPIPGPVHLDADLRDWDLSGSIECAFDEKLRPLFTATVAIMYDAEALYVGAHFVDRTPLLNRHDPAVEADRGWAGDCLQVRLCSDAATDYPLPSDTDSDRVCHLTMWCYTEAQLPVLHLAYGMDYHGVRLFTGAESGLAFRTDRDGQGYTLEARLPWDRLHAPRPLTAGDRIALVLQPLWSDGTGWKQVTSFNDVIRTAGFSFQNPAMWGEAYFSAKGNLPPESRPRTLAEQQLPLTLDLPLPDKAATSVSAALYGTDGTLLRSLLAGAVPRAQDSERAGARVLAASRSRLTLAWDGLDDDGQALAPGRYSVKVLSHRGIGQKWVLSFHNAGRPPWVLDDGTGSWGGDHAPPFAAGCDDRQVYLGWMVSEAGWAVIACRPDGQKLWGQHQVLDIGILVTGLASDGKTLYVAQDGKGWGADDKSPNKAGVVCFDAATGKPVNFPFGKRVLLVSEWQDSLKPPELQPFERLSVYHPLVGRKRFWERRRDHDFGPQEYGLNLLGIAVAGGRLYASRYLEDKVTAYDLATGNSIKEWSVTRPAGIAIAPDGSLFAVSHQRVLRLAEDGTASEFVTSGLSAPHGLATDRAGRVYLTDAGAAMQVKVFGPDGRLAQSLGKPGGRAWVGRYDPTGLLKPTGLTVDPEGKVWVCETDDTPRRISVWRDDGTLAMDLLGPGGYAVMSSVDPARPALANVHHTAFELDYRQSTARPLSTLIRPQMQGLEFTPDGLRDLHFRHAQGQTYAVHMGRGAILVLRVSDGPEGLIARPVTALGPASALPLHGFVHDDFPAAVRDEIWRNSHAYLFLWTDQNEDNLVQDGEWTFTKVDETPAKSGWGLYWGSWVDEQMTLWTASPHRTGHVFRIPVKEWRHGVPVYPAPQEVSPAFSARGRDVLHSVMTDDEGSVYLLEQSGGESYGSGSAWRAVSKYTGAGSRAWAYRRTWLGFGLEAPLATPGDVVGAMKLIGSARLDRQTRLLAVNGYFGQFNLLDSDGLWVASLCKDNRYGPRADQDTVWPENFSGFFFRHRENGRTYLMAGDTDARLWEVTGLDTLRTKRAEVTVTAADQANAERAVRQHLTAAARSTALRLARAARPVTVDGDLAEWDLAKSASLDAGAGRGAHIALAFDATNLYAAYQVQDDSPLANSGKDAALLFKTGDACDLMLATDPAADPKRGKPAPGDLRLLFSAIDGKPVAVLYQPVLTQGETAPRTFSSPVAAEAFDRVIVMEDAQVALQRSDKGYVLEARVPLAALGFSPAAGAEFRGDVGVLFSDQGGSRTVLRCYLFNHSTGVVNDVPTEARLTPSAWGRVAVE